jgi:hypothetical protein
LLRFTIQVQVTLSSKTLNIKREDITDIKLGIQATHPISKYLREGDHLEDPAVDGRIILKWIFERLGVGAQTGLIWLRIGYRWRALVYTVMNLRVP